MDETEIIETIRYHTGKNNFDNISRTEAYEQFYYRHPEIRWAFLAAMVSRNAGWNMSDLYGNLFENLPETFRFHLFLTYERANWLIFRDAYPQLLLYEYSTLFDRPLFHLLSKFQVSRFMRDEWFRYWEHRNGTRLLYALIINEQNVIQNPVIQHPFYQKNVFRSFPYKIQDFFRMNMILFPTSEGKIYGKEIYQFTRTDARIHLGKSLAALLFNPSIHSKIIAFSKRRVHTGSRKDYEELLSFRTPGITPPLRKAVPVIYHLPDGGPLWDAKLRIPDRWFQPPREPKVAEMSQRYLRKRQEMAILLALFGKVRTKIGKGKG